MWFSKFLSILSLASLLSACAINKVTFEDGGPKPGATHRQVRAVQDLCELERQMALYVDSNNNLWLNCPYRYQGTVPSMALIGPKPHAGPEAHVYEGVAQKAKTMRSVALRSCGTRRWCADLAYLDYYDFVIEFLGNKAKISYADLSPGRAAVAAFYEGLDGKPGALPLEPALKRLVNSTEVDAKLRALSSVDQLDHVQQKLAAAGLMDYATIGYLVDQRRRNLQLTAHRAQGDFDGYQAAYRLSEEGADLERMKAMALLPDQKSVVFGHLMRRYQSSRAEDAFTEASRFMASDADRAQYQAVLSEREQARLAAVRQQEEARQADLRRQEQARQAQAQREQEARLAEQRAAQARADEERCMKNPQCRAQVEQRRAQCVQTIQACRRQCDTVTGAGSYSSFTGGLVAAGLARACYGGCKCDSGFGDILSKFNSATGRGSELAPAAAPVAKAGGTGAESASAPKTYECKIYCKSASGPVVYRRFQASSRKDAAKLAGDQANQICAADGKSHANSVDLSESQCVAK